MQNPQQSPFLWDQPQAIIETIIHNVEKVIIGKRETIERTVIALLCGGHVLLEDVPGVGKTMLVRALARTIDCEFKRLQFTPDLLPSDITGISVYNPRLQVFEFREGPLFTHIVLADEMNRTSPKTQAAMLEAMEEKQVSADGKTYRLPEPFLLLATQNPYGCEGTYGLPEAQLDRFLLKLNLGYPEPREEVEMLSRLQDQHPVERLRPVVSREELLRLQQLAREIYVDDSLKEYIVGLTTATRRNSAVVLGASPRASMALMRVSQAKAFAQGRSYVIPDDIKGLAASVLAHRIQLSVEAGMSGITAEAVIHQAAETVPVPGFRFASGS